MTPATTKLTPRWMLDHLLCQAGRVDGNDYIPALLARLQDSAGGWLTPGSERLAVPHLVPLMNRAAASTTGEAARLWTFAATITSAQLWVGDLDSDRELWERVHDAVVRAAAEQPAATP